MKTKFKKLMSLLIGITANLTVHAAVSYGSGPSCDYEQSLYTLQDVIDAGEDNINLTKQSSIPATIHIIQPFIHIKGGFEDCEAANNNDPTNGQSTLLGNGLLPVIRINVPQNESETRVHLTNLVIKNGHHNMFHNGGGISAYDLGSKSIMVFVNNSLITQNTGSRGGGVFLKGEGVGMIMRDTLVLSNQTEGQAGGSALGGGIYCNGAYLKLESGSGVSQNEAYSSIQNAGHGGGIYATNDCQVDLQSGTDGGLLDFRGISFNRASGHGGGIYADDSSLVRLNSGVYNQPINVNDNQADTNLDGYGDGGGIYLSGSDTSMSVIGGLIRKNYAVNGAGISINNGTLVSIYALANQCWDELACNQISGNQTIGPGHLGGALYLNNAQLYLNRTHISKNRADEGNALYAINGSSVLMHRALVSRNGADGSGWQDKHLFRFIDSNFTINQTTTALNDVTMATVSAQNSVHVINNSIFHEPLTNQIGNFIGGSGSKDCNLVDNTFGWNNHSNTYIDNPSFVDEATDDFHIQSDSEAIDRCADGDPGSTTTDYDIDGQLAPYDHPLMVGGAGHFDMGADEYRGGDVIFAANFESP